jgi:hypothetical protein
MTELVNVVYIGDKAVKKDNVLKSRRQWIGRGAKLQVPRQDAEIYFTYRDIWAPEDEAQKLIRAKMSMQATAKPSPAVVEETKPEVQIDTSDRAQLIQGAILQLEPGNDKHYTGQGKPRVKAVIDVLGFSVEANEIEAALADLRAAGKLS